MYRLDTPPVTAAEIQAVGISLTTAQPRTLHRNRRPIGPATPDGWRAHTAEQWAALSADDRAICHTYQQIAAVFGYRTGHAICYALTVHGPQIGIDPVTGRTIPAGETPPDPSRWAPRLSPWNGAPRTGEDPAVVAERLIRDRNDRGPRPDKNDSRHDNLSDMLARMIKRRQAMSEQDPKTPPSHDSNPARSDNSINRHR